MPPTILQKLNEDELIIVFDLLDQQDLYAFARVSKYAHKIAIPYLYKHVQWTWDPEDGDHDGLVRLTRTLLTDDYHAPAIRSLSFEIIDSEVEGYRLGPWRQTAKPTCDSSNIDGELRSVRNLARHYGQCAHGDVWAQAIQISRPDAYLALLLAQATGLRSLKICEAWSCLDTMVSRLLRFVLLHQVPLPAYMPTFASLEEVECLSTFTSKDLSPRRTWELLIFFYLPNLKRLTIGLQNPRRLCWPDDKPPALLEKLEYLKLSQLREARLAEVLSLTPNIKTLVWEFSYTPYDRHQNASSKIDLTQLATTILCTVPSLARLTLSSRWIYEQDPDYDEDDDYDYDYDLHSAQLSRVCGNLTQLSRLEHLHTLSIALVFTAMKSSPLDAVVGSSVRHLVLVDDGDSHAYWAGDVGMFQHPNEQGWRLFDWVDGWKTMRPSLQDVTLQSAESHFGWKMMLRVGMHLGMIVKDGRTVVWDPKDGLAIPEDMVIDDEVKKYF